MRIFFLNPVPNLKLSLGIYRFLYTPVPPIWAGYLSAIAKKYTDEIKVLDNCVEFLDLKETIRRITDFSPDILCISVLTQTASFSFNVARAIRELLPKTKIIMGGAHASYFAYDIVKNNLADAVAVGEGEETFDELLRSIQDGQMYITKGGVFRIDGKIIQTEQRDRIKNVDSLPFPAWEYFKDYMKFYKTVPPNKKVVPVLTILGSRGCPFSCNFCMVQMGRRYTIRSPENICDEMELFYEKYGCRHFWFVDPLFPPSKSVGLKIMSYMAKRGIGKKITWDCETRADIVDEELAEALREAGCTLVALGIEGGDDKILENINKKLKIETVRKAVKALKKYGIRTMGLYMLGTPGETIELAEKTIKFARELKTYGAKFSITVPYPGTEIWEQYVKGKYEFKEEDWDRFSSYNPDYPYELTWTEIKPKKLIELQRKAHIYANLSLEKVIRFILDRGVDFFSGGFRTLNEHIKEKTFENLQKLFKIKRSKNGNHMNSIASIQMKS